MPVGATYGRWTVISGEPQLSGQHYRIPCECECGSVGYPLMHHLRSGQSKSCGCYARDATRRFNRSSAGNWKGGRIVTEEGYVHIYDPEHPNAKSNGYAPEHRLVMSRMLGRPLEKGENVHHINGVRDDNRPENLELWVTSQPRGQRVQDLLDWARELIDKYGEMGDRSTWRRL